MKLTSTQLRRIIREEVKKAKRLNEGGMYVNEQGLAGLQETIDNIKDRMKNPSDVYDDVGFLNLIDESISFLQELRDNYK